MRNVPGDSVEQMKARGLGSIPSFEHRALYETMGKNMVEPDRPQMAVRRMGIAFWAPKGTNTRSEYVIRIAFHGNRICMNASQCYVINAMRLSLSFGGGGGGGLL
jgi:hypothetical protein